MKNTSKEHRKSHSALQPTTIRSSPTTHNFTVAVRIKPSQQHEENIKVILNKNAKEMSIERTKSYKNINYGNKCKHFKMDNIFNECSSNEQIFREVVQEKLLLLKQNCNISMMAYGATNSGKTYTIFGNSDREKLGSVDRSQGLIHISTKYLIQELFQSGYKFYFSYIQIYNENVQDLLANNQKKHYLNIFEDHTGKINIPDLTKVQLQDYSHLSELINKGNKIRAESSNNINNISSRSHAILQIDIFSVQDNESGSMGKPVDVNFMIIDLAGSEKSTPYFQESQQQLMKQGSNINRSLLALGNCIKNLSNGDNHIPYRDSKLTRLLKDNLSGNSHNLMVACVSQSSNQYEQTINTLQYALKACKIQTNNTQWNKDKNKHINFACDHCKMSIDYHYINLILNRHGYQINLKDRPFLQRQSKLQTLLNEESVNNELQSIQEKLINDYILRLNKLKQRNVKFTSLIELNQHLNMLENEPRDIQIKIQQVEFAQENLLDDLWAKEGNNQTSRLILKKRKENESEKSCKEIRSVKLQLKSKDKQQKHAQVSKIRSISEKIIQKNNKQHNKGIFIEDDSSNNFKLQPPKARDIKFQFINLIQKQKDKSKDFIKIEQPNESHGPSLKCSSIKNQQDSHSIPAFTSSFSNQLNLQISQFNSIQSKKQSTIQSFPSTLNTFRLKNVELVLDLDQDSQNNMNGVNVYKEDFGKIKKHSRQRILSSFDPRQQKKAEENQGVRRMKPDNIIINQTMMFLDVQKTEKDTSIQSMRTKIKMIPKLRS